MKSLLYSLVCILAFISLPLRAQVDGEEQRLFAAATYESRFEHAKRLNAQAHYMEAFEALKTLHKDLLETITAEGFSAATLPQRADFHYYLTVLSSEAECAYKLNLGNEVHAAHSELVNAFAARMKSSNDKIRDYYWPVGADYKVLGDLYYLLGAKQSLYYEEAQEAYESAINYFSLANDDVARAKVYFEQAQVAYVQEHYDDALDYIELAIGGMQERRATGSNARVSFTNEERQPLDIMLQSAKAMCLARNHEFRSALNTIDEAMGRLPKGDKRIAELKRRKAKILMLQHEKNGTDIGAASSLYAEYFKAVKDSVNANFLQMTADQREEFWMIERPFIVDCYQLEDNSPELLYDVTLYNKGMLLQMARSFDNLLYDGTAKGKANERGLLNELRQQDAINARDGRVTSYAADYEHQLLQTMSADGRCKKFFRSLNYTWRDVQRVLPNDGCAIEFVEYEKGDASHFGALVLRKKGNPRFVYVCNADELADFEPNNGFWPLRTLLRTTYGSLKDDIYEDEDLPYAIWNADLRAAIGESKKVYFSCDGYFHQLAIEYLLPQELQDKNFYRLSSTRVLAEGSKVNADKIKNAPAFVLGGIKYDAGISSDRTSDSGNDAAAFQALQDIGASFSYMQGAKVECDSIVCYRNNPEDFYLQGLEATEHAFYENCSKYALLHISTHGYFGGDMTISDELLPSSTKDVLSESTMALSFAESNLRNIGFDPFMKDGLLSAREVARLDLENVELVTTSACQTALGYITADGIYGMQRGFKSAGAKAMLMTLWSVNIESARIFFTTFYRYMAEGESLPKAFMHARNDLLTKTYEQISYYPKFNAATMSSSPVPETISNSFASPYHSCPYILIDAWE